MPVRNPVLLTLLILLAAGAIGLPFLTHAPNRLLSGRPIFLSAIENGARWLALLPALPLLAGPFLPTRRPYCLAVAAGAAVLIPAVVWLAGKEASALVSASSPAARTGLGAGFWVIVIASALAYLDALGRLRPGKTGSVASLAAAVLPVGFLLATGQSSDLSLLKEYAARSDVFAAAFWRHMLIVGITLSIAVPAGIALGVIAQRQAAARRAIFPVLNIIQTIPSIALFGLMLPVLSGLTDAVPGLTRLGIGGVGVAPAVIALALYSLLPIARNTLVGLAGVAPSVTEAAQAIGMTPRAVLWQVQAPLALPAILSGLRIATVQLIGLAIIAALIGAGGLGDIIFQGLFANAVDLVILGVIPVVALASLADLGFRLLIDANGPQRT